MEEIEYKLLFGTE